jgi:thiamine-phosphate pyrophosphorylase
MLQFPQMPKQMLRIIDANCNRISEGLRFLEEVARFILDDASLSKELKTIRHNVVKSISKVGVKLISQRDSESDVGARVKSLSKQQDLPALITANAKRVEEGLRVVEELSKVPELSQILDSYYFQQARFQIYKLEKILLSRILRQQKLVKLRGLYIILDTQVLGTKDIAEAATQTIRGGARIIQLRDKQCEKGELLTIARKLKDICLQMNTLFIMNDHLDIALAVDADGLHIGQKDLPLTIARKELPIDKIIGCSTTTLKQALKAQTEGADYIAVGAMFSTPTKKDATVVGTKRLNQIKQIVSVPVVAIGGINSDNVSEVIAAGADAMAIISAILDQKDIEKATRQMVSKIEQKRKNNRKSGNNR